VSSPSPDPEPSRASLLSASPGFRWLWLATLVSTLGDWLGFVALNLYVFALTGSATALAGVLAAEAVPALLLGPAAGVVADRASRRRVMIVANLVAAVTYALLALSTSLWQVYALALLTRTTATFFGTAERALVPDLVGPDRALAANSALTAATFTTLVVGPAAAGLLVAAYGAPVALWANALSFVGSALCIARVPEPPAGERPAGLDRPGWLDDIRAGLGYALARPALRVLLLTTFVSSLAAAALLTVEVVYVKDVLHGGDRGYGVLLSVCGLGAVVASATAGPLGRRVGLAGLYVASLALAGLLFFPYANVPVLWFVVVTSGLQTVPWVLGSILVDTMVQQWVAADVRGRVFSLLQVQRSASAVLVAAALAPLVDRWGPVAVLNLSGGIYTLAGLYALARLRVLRWGPDERAFPGAGG
jgi:MFS family permease